MVLADRMQKSVLALEVLRDVGADQARLTLITMITTPTIEELCAPTR